MATRVTVLVSAMLLSGGCVAIDDFSMFSEGPGSDAGADAGGVDGGGVDGGVDAGPCVPEVCNGEDDDCDGTTDEEPTECSFANAVVGCVAGSCEMTGCVGGFLDCTSDDGCETDPMTDAAHCGGCDLACPFGERCSAGVCNRPLIEDVVQFASAEDTGVGEIAVDAAGAVFGSAGFQNSLDLPGGTLSASRTFVQHLAVFKLDGTTLSRLWAFAAEPTTRITPGTVGVAPTGVAYFAGRSLGDFVVDGRTYSDTTRNAGVFVWSLAPDGATRFVEDYWGTAVPTRLGLLAGSPSTSLFGSGAPLDGTTALGSNDVFHISFREPGPTTTGPAAHGGTAHDSLGGVTGLTGGGVAHSVAFEVSGSFFGATVSAPMSDGEQAALVVTGDPSWEVVGGQAGPETGGAVTSDDDDNIYWQVDSGTLSRPGSPVDIGLGPVMGVRSPFVVIASFGRDGTPRWSRALDDIGISAMTVLGDELILVGGMVAPGELEPGASLTNLGDVDSLVVALRLTDGAIRWVWQFGGATFDLASGIASTPDGSLLVSGLFRDSAAFGTRTLTSLGGADGYLVRIRP